MRYRSETDGDILSEVLDTIRVGGAAGYRAELTAPWGLAVPHSVSSAPFYVVSEGSIYLSVRTSPEGAEPAFDSPRMVEGGDLVMLPSGSAHRIQDAPRTAVADIRSVVPGYVASGGTIGDAAGEAIDDSIGADTGGGARRPGAALLRYGGGGEKTEIFTGSFRFDDDPTTTILRSLGTVVHVRGRDEATPDFRAFLGLSCHEMRHPTPGSRFVSSELTKLLFIQVLRSAMIARQRDNAACAAHPFALMFHPQMTGVADAIHRHPEVDWKVETLAARAGMSRTAFSLRFTELTGSSPLAYLTRWRMIKASQLLRTTDATLADVATKVGYGSEAAFSTAFKRETGAAPGRYRENARTSGSAA